MLRVYTMAEPLWNKYATLSTMNNVVQLSLQMLEFVCRQAAELGPHTRPS